jgi:hypothetical protein
LYYVITLLDGAIASYTTRPTKGEAIEAALRNAEKAASTCIIARADSMAVFNVATRQAILTKLTG